MSASNTTKDMYEWVHVCVCAFVSWANTKLEQEVGAAAMWVTGGKAAGELPDRTARLIPKLTLNCL